MKTILFCFGTRPEAIKMAPVIKETNDRGHKAIVCLTGQHKDMIIPFLDFFKIKADFDLDIMKPNQSLADMTANILTKVSTVLDEVKPDFVCVQGDTTTTFTCGLAAFYKKIPVANIEAGLRTGDMYSPFPEEANRRLVTAFAEYFFPPTQKSADNLLAENISKNVYVTGNTSIDALRMTSETIQSSGISNELLEKYNFVDSSKKLILVTAHRRENHGEPLINICEAIKELAEDKSLQFVIPVHLNPNVKDVIHGYFDETENVFLLKPLDYVDFSWFMSKSFFILTDSGGVQEEGPYFKKPILVLRENTERPEGVDQEVSILLGSNKDKIISTSKKLINDPEYYQSFSKNVNPYGDGFASKLILDIITQ